MKKSTLGTGALAIIGLLFIGVMVLANSLLRGAQLDLTEDNLYTISDGTENIVRGLKEPVNLYLFFSERTATPMPQVKNHGVRVRELLEELAARSDGKLLLKVIDPQPFSEEEDRATELGVTPVPVHGGADKLYLGLAATNSTDGQAAIPYLDPQQEELLEYDVAKLIHQLASNRRPVVGWLSTLPMSGDFDMQSGQPRPPWYVYGQAEQLFTVRNLEPTLTAIDADVDVLVLVHPKDLPPAALYAIDQYALRGGRLLVFVDPNAQQDNSGADPNNPMAQFTANKSSQLEPLLAAWGVEFKPGEVVADLERGLVVGMREGEPPTRHIAILGFERESLAKDVITAGLGTINMATTGSLKPRDGAKIKFEPLIHTSKQAGVLPVERFAMLSDPASLRDGFRPTGTEYAVAARVSGEVTSAFPDGPPGGATAPAAPLKASAKPLNLLIFADTDLLSDFMWVQQRNFFGQVLAQPFANNGDLVWNALDNLSGSADLISVRGRAAFSRPFDRVEELRRSAEDKFRATEQQLESELQQTEERLSALQTARGGDNGAILSSEQAQEIERFQAEKLRIRKELRAVKSGLERDIKALGTKMKIINIIAAPAIFTVIALLVAGWSRRRRAALAMLRKSAAT